MLCIQITQVQNDDLNAVLISTLYERRFDASAKTFWNTARYIATTATAPCTVDYVLKFSTIFETQLMLHIQFTNSPPFKTAVIEIQSNRKKDLKALKNPGVRLLLTDITELNAVSDIFVERTLQRLRPSTSTKKFEYIDARYFNPTFYCCARLSSTSGQALFNRRCGFLPMNYENQMFLNIVAVSLRRKEAPGESSSVEEKIWIGIPLFALSVILLRLNNSLIPYFRSNLILLYLYLLGALPRYRGPVDSLSRIQCMPGPRIQYVNTWPTFSLRLSSPVVASGDV